MVFRIRLFYKWILVHQQNGVVSGTKFIRLFFAERGRNRCRSRVFPILDISIRSGDIRDLCLKLSEVDRNFARFWPHIFGASPPKFWDYRLYKKAQLTQRERATAVHV